LIFQAKLAATKALKSTVKALGRGGGTTLPGKALLKLDSKALTRLTESLTDGSYLISATNGKTTTAAVLRKMLECTGTPYASNDAGANMPGGLVSALIDKSHVTGKVTDKVGLFEVDEFWLPEVQEQVKPKAVLLGNLFRDQLDRYGELETIAERWKELYSKSSDTCLVANADDPLISDIARQSSQSIYYGVEDQTVALQGMQHATDSKSCRNCGHPYSYDLIYIGHLGIYHCPECGQSRPSPDVLASQVQLLGTDSSRFKLDTPIGSASVDLPLPGLYNVYNALAAAALAYKIGIPFDKVVEGIESVTPAFGRAETVSVAGRKAKLLLIKNPVGANEVLRTLSLEKDRNDLLILLNDRTADGRDVSWIWDCDFELLRAGVRSIVCSGTRADEIAQRLKYAGLNMQSVTVEADIEKAMQKALSSGEGQLFILPTYTALLEVQDLLAKSGVVQSYWEQNR